MQSGPFLFPFLAKLKSFINHNKKVCLLFSFQPSKIGLGSEVLEQEIRPIELEGACFLMPMNVSSFYCQKTIRRCLLRNILVSLA